MSRVLAILVRFAAILAGYSAAALAASAFLHLIVLGPLSADDRDAVWITSGSLLVSIPFVGLVIAYFAFLPSIPLIIAGELIGRRDWLFHVLGGGAVALVVTVLFLASDMHGAEPARDPGFLAAFVAAGLAGGFGYWLVAGRGAGGWRTPISPGPSGS